MPLARAIIVVVFIAGLIVGMLICEAARAGDYGPYNAQLVSVYDGDTFTASVAIWPGINAHTSIRVIGIDAPEIRGAGECEKLLAIAARDYARGLLAGAAITLHSVKLDAYPGRVDAVVLFNGQPFAAAMITAGHARPYNGGQRLPWCT